MKRIYLFNIVAWNYRKKIGFPVCKKENFAGLQAHRKRGKSARASPTPHHTLNEERSPRFNAQHLSALSENQAIHGALDPWNPYIKIEILIYCPYTFSIEVVGIFAEVSIRLIFPDHVLNSHDNSVFQSIDVTRRNFMLITPGGVLRISSDRDVPMGAKINTPKNPLGFK